MADTKMRIKIRRDISTKWADINPKLLSGEQGFEVDTGKMKIGDGSARWNSLPYFGNDISQSEGKIVTTRIDLLDTTANRLKRLQVYSDAVALQTQDQATNILIDSIFDTKDKVDESILKVNIKINNTKTELLDAVSDIREDVNEAVGDLNILKNETVSIVPDPTGAYIEHYGGGQPVGLNTLITNDQVWGLSNNGQKTTSSPNYGVFFPYDWIKKNYPQMMGFSISDGIGLSGLYDQYQSAKKTFDPTAAGTDASVRALNIDGVPGIGVWFNDTVYGNYYVRLYGIQVGFSS